MTDRTFILGLAPSAFSSARTARYQGRDEAVALAALEPDDQGRVVQIYALLDTVAKDLATHASPTRDASDTLWALVTELGKDAVYPRPVAQAIHDLRGGALSALLLQLGAPGLSDPLLRRLRGLTRDSMKVMRTLIQPLDPESRARDLEMRPHSLASFAASIESYEGTGDQGRVRVIVHHDETAIVAASCTELATIERVAFNLLDNASRHTRVAEIEAWLVVVGEHVRVAVENVISPDEAERLAAMSPKTLYTDFSTSGSGLGLQTVLRLVGSAYGIDDTAALIDGGYVGWKVSDESFIAWFHWPLAE